MANEFKGPVIYIDGIMGSPHIFRNAVKITKIYWFAPAGTAAEAAVIVGADGLSKIWEGALEDNGKSQTFNFKGILVNGFQVTTLDAGVLYIYVDRT